MTAVGKTFRWVVLIVFTRSNDTSSAGTGPPRAANATTGEPLWHCSLNTGMSNAPISYELDGTQYVVIAAGDTIYSFAMFAKQ